MAALTVCTAGAGIARADATYSSDYRYVDGTMAHAETVCATADLCGTIALRGGENIFIYAEQAFGCELPTLHIVHRRGSATVLSYQMDLGTSTGHRQASGSERPASYRCASTRAYVSFDKGRVRMAVFPLAADNQLFVRFSAGYSQEHTNAAPAVIRAR